MSKSSTNVGLAGLGIIGSRSAANLRKAGFTVSTWSRTKRSADEGAVASAADLAKGARFIQFFVRDHEALTDAVEDMLPALTPEHVLINSATVSLGCTEECAEMVAKKGAAWLDAPFTGSRDAAQAGQLVYYIGGDEAVLEQARPVLQATAKSILHLGPIGHGTIIKIATNMVSAVTVQVLSEALGVVKANGVPLEKFAEAMEVNGCCSPLVRMKLPGMVAGDYTPHFSLNNMLKDSRYARDLAGFVEVPALNAVSECMEGLMAGGRGELDYSVLASNYL